jgi:hypothetical protein
MTSILYYKNYVKNEISVTNTINCMALIFNLYKGLQVIKVERNTLSK